MRKLRGAGSTAEGWVHCAEQVTLDEGFAAGDRKMRLGQLQDALLRNARYMAGIGMSTGAMTYPTYLVYTLGMLQEFHDRFLGQGFPPVPIVRSPGCAT